MMEQQTNTETPTGAASELNDGLEDDAWTKLRQHWNEATARERDWRTKGEAKLLEQMHDAWSGLKACGWREIEYCPKDGTRFLAICAGSTGVFPHYYQGTWPKGSWWCEAHGDLWPSRPILWKPLESSNAKIRGGAQS